ncbi:lipase-3 domain-containing protein [Favolaschia claudopus]|uniref:Lipase-3 domain-containing protein n=1 Tax=Favolaschia claudopus TaxID=2862362 RepID=A0AAW0CYG4_9AGAR
MLAISHILFHLLRLCFLFPLTGVQVFAVPVPLFGFGSSSKEGTDAPSPVTIDTVNSTLLRPAQFARAAYCSSGSLTSWTCGVPCQSLSGVEVLQTGGDSGLIPLYFIAHDPVDQSLVVAHEGTDPDNLLSILNDAEFALVDIDTQRIPQAAGKNIKVHDGLQSTFQRTADGLLSGVQAGLQSTGVKKVVVTGHSQGAALATMTGAMLKGALDPSIDVVITTFGLPRGGNAAWADFLDQNIPNTFVTNQNDPVPTVPPLLFGFAHGAGEMHISSSDQPSPEIVSCPGHDNENCATGNSIFKTSVANHLGPYFDGISFGGSQCSS